MELLPPAGRNLGEMELPKGYIQKIEFPTETSIVRSNVLFHYLHLII